MRIFLLALAFAAGSVTAAVACPYNTAEKPGTIAQADQSQAPSTKIQVPRQDG